MIHARDDDFREAGELGPTLVAISYQQPYLVTCAHQSHRLVRTGQSHRPVRTGQSYRPEAVVLTMLFTRLPLALTFLHGALASQPSAPSPIAAPLRQLPWGQLNFLQTTDTHGWHGGHLQEYVVSHLPCCDSDTDPSDRNTLPIGATTYRSHTTFAGGRTLMAPTFSWSILVTESRGTDYMTPLIQKANTPSRSSKNNT